MLGLSKLPDRNDPELEPGGRDLFVAELPRFARDVRDLGDETFVARDEGDPTALGNPNVHPELPRDGVQGVPVRWVGHVGHPTRAQELARFRVRHGSYREGPVCEHGQAESRVEISHDSSS